MSLISGFWLWIMVYSKGFKKSFWNLKFGNSSFSRNRIASWRRESKAKKPTCGLLWQHTCKHKISKWKSQAEAGRLDLCALPKFPTYLTIQYEYDSCCNKKFPPIFVSWTNEVVVKDQKIGFLPTTRRSRLGQSPRWPSKILWVKKLALPYQRTPDR